MRWVTLPAPITCTLIPVLASSVSAALRRLPPLLALLCPTRPLFVSPYSTVCLSSHIQCFKMRLAAARLATDAEAKSILHCILLIITGINIVGSNKGSSRSPCYSSKSISWFQLRERERERERERRGRMSLSLKFSSGAPKIA